MRRFCTYVKWSREKRSISYLLINTAFLFFLIIITNSCKKPCHDSTNPDCENYDPDWRSKVSNFTMRQSWLPFGWGETQENIAEYSDTIATSLSGVLFSATEQNAKRYEWTIGEDKRKFITRTVALRFDDYLKTPGNIGKKIPVKLKVVIAPKGSNMSDTVFESERFLVFKAEFLWDGTFEGYFDHEPNIKREVTILSKGVTYLYPPGSLTGYPKDTIKSAGYLFKGLLPKPLMFVSNDFIIERYCSINFYSHKQWKWMIEDHPKQSNLDIDALSDGLMSFHAYARYSEDGKPTIVVLYSHRTSRKSKEIYYVFRGKKIN